MKKPMTKAAREAKEKAALRQRIADIYAGACGGEISKSYRLDLDELERIMVAFRDVLFTDTEFKNKKHLFRAFNLHKYKSIDTITEFYYRHGVRA